MPSLAAGLTSLSLAAGLTSLSLAAGLACCSCGSNTPEIPDALLHDDAGAPTDCADAGELTYPAGPYGTTVGSIIENLSFMGWPNAAEAQGELSLLQLSDFYDPEGTEFEIILLNGSALWCGPCQEEHKELPEFYLTHRPLGLAILGTLFEDRDHEPAEQADLEVWVNAFGTNFPMGLDPTTKLGLYGKATEAPINIIIDARTMGILTINSGRKNTEQLIVDELTQRASQ